MVNNFIAILMGWFQSIFGRGSSEKKSDDIELPKEESESRLVEPPVDESVKLPIESEPIEPINPKYMTLNLVGQLDTSKIVQIDFPEDQYIKQEQKKTQIVLHHSAGWDNARGMFAGWMADKQRVATACGIVDDGTIFQAFSSKYWAYHVNILSKGNPENMRSNGLGKYANMATYNAIEQRTIGVEICNWGQLWLINGKYHTWASAAVNPKYKKDITVPESKVVHYPNKFRGFEYYESYTAKEIESTWKLVRYWCDHYGISKEYSAEMWSVNERALSGQLGVTAHVSFRYDKVDIHPQPEMIEMLKAL